VVEAKAKVANNNVTLRILPEYQGSSKKLKAAGLMTMASIIYLMAVSIPLKHEHISTH
jgi:hypothetical protein